jgi:poly(A) polymerase
MGHADHNTRFRTAHEAIDWIRWDEAFDASSFIVGYDAHEDEPVEVPLIELDPSGEIPWHRIRYIRFAEGGLVWSRDERIDRLTELRRR